MRMFNKGNAQCPVASSRYVRIIDDAQSHSFVSNASRSTFVLTALQNAGRGVIVRTREGFCVRDLGALNSERSSPALAPKYKVLTTTPSLPLRHGFKTLSTRFRA